MCRNFLFQILFVTQIFEFIKVSIKVTTPVPYLLEIAEDRVVVEDSKTSILLTHIFTNSLIPLSFWCNENYPFYHSLE